MLFRSDQPPEMMYYAAMAMKELGDNKTANERFEALIDYGNQHGNDEIKIEYFAVSLPDFLIFDGDLNRKNKVHCLFMAALGYFGKGEMKKAAEYAQKGLALDQCHMGLTELLAALKEIGKSAGMDAELNR